MTDQAGAPEPGPETPPTGLTPAQVQERIARGQVNVSGERTSRTFGEIVRANVFTRFNALLGTMFVLILVAGSPRDGLFGIVLVSNALIGIVQEYRAKRTLDQLAVLNAPRARIVRAGDVDEVAVEQIVLDDLLELRTGDQVPADGIVRLAEGLEIDESLLTGESDPIDKEPGDEVLSGSIVVAGAGRFQATRVGDEAYARKIAAEARRFQLVHSELMTGINTLLRYITWAILPTAALLALSQFHATDGWQEALTGIVAGTVAMVPEGLVLLTSIAFGVATVTLARRKVLVQELPAVEGLARVDVVCLDKTGTITDGNIVFDRIERLDDATTGAPTPVEQALAALAADENRNATMAAVADAFPAADGWVRTASVAFSSARKWSGASFADQGTWIIGAPEMVRPGRDDEVSRQAAELAASGQRVLILVHSSAPIDGDALPPDLTPAALVLFQEQVRPDAAETIRYFADQGVALKVISGDNPQTVGAVAQRVGLPQAGRPYDARELPEDQDELAEVLEERTVFGRVSPHQKQEIVKALQSRGHVVAMTGDGVNDALALKLADIGIAMGSGAPATRSVAQLVLLDGRFATMPGVVAEGRRVIANIERVANLFLTKTVYAMLLAIAVGVVRWPYPFLPRHLTVVSTLTIGVPAFFIALAPNKRRYVPGFVPRVLRFAIPAGLIAAVATFSAFWLARAQDALLIEQRTSATITLLIIGLWILVILARPMTLLRAFLVMAMIGAFAVALGVPFARDFFEFNLPDGELTGQVMLIAFGALVLLEAVWQSSRKLGRGPAAAVGMSTGATTSSDV